MLNRMANAVRIAMGLMLICIATITLASDLPQPSHVLVTGVTEVHGVDDAPERYAQYREQNVVVTNSDRVVVIAQGRDPSRWSDRSGQDLVVRYSDDSGATWSDALLACEHGDYSVCPNAAVYDRQTDEIHVLYSLFLWDFNLTREGPASVGDGPECKQYQITSGDGGETWSEPRDISSMFPQSAGRVVVFGSGEGIQIQEGEHAGRLVVPGGLQGRWGNRMFYSDDHGQTWINGEIAPREQVRDNNVRLENKVTELADGRLLMNARCAPLRARAWSSDGGVTWTTQELDPGLEAVSCNGSLLAVWDEQGDREVVLCAYPAGPGRTHGVVSVSFDGGQTWPMTRLVVETEFAYSSLVALPNGDIGLFYEARGHRDIDLVTFPLSWLLAPQEQAG